jgi:lipopolysaccharide heptosyltransferase II
MGAGSSDDRRIAQASDANRTRCSSPKEVGETLNSVLVVGPAWVGDMVMAQSLFMSLRHQHPEIQIDVIAPLWSRPLLARMPQVRAAIDLPLRHGQFGLGVRWRIGKSLRTRHYDQAIVLPRSFKSALIPFHARIPRRTGYRGETRYGLINDMRPLDQSVLTQTVQRYVALGQPPGSPLPPPVPYPRLLIDEVNRKRLLKKLNLFLDRPIIGIMPGAEYGPAKCWPLEYYGELAKRLDAAGYQVWVFGSAKDRPAGEWIQVLSGGKAVNLCGRTRLEDAVDLLSLAKKVVTNDSGLMHVAAAVGTRVIALYGSSTPAYTPPLTDNKVVFYRALKCSPCFEQKCPLGHYRCLRDLPLEEVFTATRA